MTKDDVRAAARRWEPAAGRQAGRRLPGQPDRLRRAGRRPRGWPGWRPPRPALRDARWRRPGCRCATCGCATSGGDTARVEVDAALVPELAGRGRTCWPPCAGFDRVEVDPRGFRSGSMNELLPDPVRYR